MRCLIIASILSVIFNHVHATPLPSAPTNGFSSTVDIQRRATENDDLQEHIVIFNNHAPHPRHVLKRVNLTETHPRVRYIFNNSGFRGFVAHVPAHHAAALIAMSDIQHVERPVEVKAESQGRVLSRPSSTWGLERISSSGAVRGNLKSTSYDYSFTNPSLGSRVDIYIVDTGIYTENILFSNNRAHMGFSFSANIADENGHGTHVSGTAGGRYFGVASQAHVIGVKVFGGSGAGTSSETLAGMNYVVQQHDSRRGQPGYVGSVMNLSWGLSTVSSVIDTAVAAAADAGVHVSLAAGNKGGDACKYSPASVGGVKSNAVISVGSVGQNGTISSFSDTGPCVDIYAPGETILSAWRGGRTNVKFLTGTSMSTPHVTGVIAYLMAGDPSLAASPSLLKSKLLSMALPGVVHGKAVSGDRKLLLNNGVTFGAGRKGLTFGGPV